MRSLLNAAYLAAALSVPASAQALVPLEENPRVISGFYAIGLADEVRTNCPSISPRWVRALSFLKSLESYALKAGYSSEQIKRLTKNDAARDALRARIRADLAKRGARPGAAEAYCAVGREEIANGTAAGRLITE